MVPILCENAPKMFQRPHAQLASPTQLRSRTQPHTAPRTQPRAQSPPPARSPALPGSWEPLRPDPERVAQHYLQIQARRSEELAAVAADNLDLDSAFCLCGPVIGMSAGMHMSQTLSSSLPPVSLAPARALQSADPQIRSLPCHFSPSSAWGVPAPG